MSIYFEPDLYVEIIELEPGPAPLPLQNGFSADALIACRALHAFGVFAGTDLYINNYQTRFLTNETSQRTSSAY